MTAETENKPTIEQQLAQAHDLLARAGTALIMLMSCINEDLESDATDPLNICAEEMQIVDDIHAFLEGVKINAT